MTEKTTISREELLAMTEEVIDLYVHLLRSKNVTLVCINSCEEQLDESLAKTRKQFPELVQLETMKGYRKLPFRRTTICCTAYLTGVQAESEEFTRYDHFSGLSAAFFSELKRTLSFFVRRRIYSDRLADGVLCLFKKYGLFSFIEGGSVRNHTESQNHARHIMKLLDIQKEFLRCTFTAIDEQYVLFQSIVSAPAQNTVELAEVLHQ